jgi:hypothetical protein
MGIKALDGANRRIVSYVVIVGLALAFLATADVGTRLAYSEVALTARVEAAVVESKANTRRAVRVILHSPYGN